ncbi:APC family permease [Nocardioides nitrophenolicus]|uniref:APC family permease n=1 Tax=Nocardioides nitrophenolicus TaxID=60489 RepID=UPI00195E83F8|nr:APC family permease [Nocardioides nitrophenolicus]MBM7516680.1 amino acid transporter [Nocardioides nitrophenolicus]
MDASPSRLPALEQALADPPSLPDVREQSALAGLARRRVRPIDLLGHSVAVVAPSASALSSPFLMQRVVGPGAWLSAVIGFALALLLSSVFSQYATRVAAPGSMYTWVTRSLGPRLGLLIATSMLLGYGALVTFGVSASVRHGTAAGESAGWGEVGVPVQLGLAVVVALVCVAISIRGVSVSTRVALSAEVLLVLSLVLLAATTFGREGLHLDGLLSLEGASPGRILLGASYVMSITVGFESSAALAAEAERPFLGVPRSLVGTVAISAALYALAYVATHAIVTGADARPRGPAQRWFPDDIDAHVADAVLEALLCVGYLTLALCALNALARVVFSLAREGLLPAAMGRTHRRWLSPYGALVAMAPVAVLPAFVAALTGNEIGSITSRLLGAAVLVLAIAYAVVALSVPVFLARLREVTWAPVVIALTAAALTTVVSVLDVVDDLDRGRWLACLLAALTLLVGTGWYAWLRRRRPATLAGMGIHDETIAADLLHR